MDWAADGYEQGPAGYPVATSELLDPNDTYWSSQQFQHDTIFGSLEASSPIIREYDDGETTTLYERVQSCINAPFTDNFSVDTYAVKDSNFPAELDCISIRHIVQDHFAYEPLHPQELQHFTICAQNTLQAEIYTGDTDFPNWGMQRGNTLGEANSVVLMDQYQNVVTAWSKRWGSPDSEKSRDFTRCAVGLGLLY